MITPHGPVEAGEIADDAITTAKIADDAVTTGKILDANVTPAKVSVDIVAGVAADYKIARGSVSVTGTSDVTTGLATVDSVTASLGEDPDGNAATVTAAIGGVAGHADLKVWKLNEAAPNTLIASGVAKTVNWIAVGA